MLVALLCALIASALAGVLFCLPTTTLRSQPDNVTGLTLTILGSGIANFFGGSLNKLAGGVGQISVAVTSSGFQAVTPLSGLGVPGRMLFSYGFLTYVAIVLAILVSLVPEP